MAERSHRATTVGVLRDYAALAAGEMVRRATAEIGYYGYYPVITRLVGAAKRGEPLPGPDDVASDDEVSRAAELIATTFRLQADTAELVVAGRGFDGEAEAYVRGFPHDLETRGGLGEDPYGVDHPVLANRLRTFAWAAVGSPSGNPKVEFVGFEVDREALGRGLREAADRASLLPATLLHAEGYDTDVVGVSVRLIDPRGDIVFSRGAGENFGERDGYDQSLSAEQVFDDSYGGLFEGYRVEAAIDPQMASRLVIGGLPRSRLPLLSALTLLAAALGVGAFLQIRRERALARLRSDFVARVSHELRTPLAQIRLFGETLRLGRVRSEEERERALEVIDRESTRLTALIDNVLRFSRAERGLDRLCFEMQDLTALVREIARDVMPLVEHRGVHLELDVADGPLPVLVDRDALHQIVLNLLENAVQHGTTPQTVTLGLTGDSEARLWVQDQGPGVPKKERQRIFEPYVRGEGSNGGGGAGIGLAVVRDLAERLGGDVRCESSDSGALFVLSLPWDRDSQPPRGAP